MGQRILAAVIGIGFAYIGLPFVGLPIATFLIFTSKYEED